jgi:hypothetical protein
MAREAVQLARTARLLGDGLAHFSSDQLREVGLYVVARLSNYAGSELGFSLTTLMRL